MLRLVSRLSGKGTTAATTHVRHASGTQRGVGKLAQFATDPVRIRGLPPVSDQHLLYGIIGTNVAVFLAWHTQSNRLMMDNFTLTLASVLQGRVHTLLTSLFSHANFGHLAMNMITLFFFGSSMIGFLGQRRFLMLYLGGGLMSSMCVLAYNAIRGDAPTLGASGAVNSIVMTSVVLNPRATIYLYLVVPVPAAIVGALYVGVDLYGAYTGGSHTAHAGHLGGAAVGMLYGLALRRPMRF